LGATWSPPHGAARPGRRAVRPAHGAATPGRRERSRGEARRSGPTEPWPGHVAGRPRRGNEADGPLSAVRAIDHDEVFAHAAVVVGEADRRIRDLAHARFVAELDEDLGRLRHARRAERMAAADEP